MQVGLISQPDLLRSICDTVFSLNDLSGASNASWRTEISNDEKEIQRRGCTCTSSYVHGKPRPFVNRVITFRKSSLGLGLQFLNHNSSCPLFKRYPKSTVVTVAVQYVGILLTRAIRVLIAIDRGAGGISINHTTLDTARIVSNDSQAFKLVKWNEAFDEGKIKNIVELDKYLRDSYKELQLLFDDGNASPYDVDELGNTLLHVRICVMLLSSSTSLTSFSAGCKPSYIHAYIISCSTS